MAEKKTRLSIYLIKSDCTDEESILSEEKSFRSQEIAGVGHLYHARSFSSKPQWIDSFFGDSIDDSEIYNATASALLLVPLSIDGNLRYFAIAFGRGLSLINKSCIEERFGLKTVLNSVESNSIRRIAKTEIAGNASKTNEQMPKKSEIHDFALDIERDLLNGITATGNDDSLLSGSITGTDSLSVSSVVRIEDLPGYLEEIHSVYKSERYKEHFPWVDHIAPVRNSALKQNLDEALIESVKSGDVNIWMAVPGLINWEETAGFRYQGSREIHDDILIDKVLETLRNPFESVQQLKNKQIFQIGTIDDSEIDHWSAYKCLYGELEYQGQQYCINGGEWFRIEPDYVKRINNQYSATAVSTFEFPAYAKDEQGEGAYNERICSENPDSRILMDQKFIMHGGANSKFELCDILGRDGSFIHVKRYSGSATLSHLFNQGLTTAELVRSDSSFLEKANEKIAEVQDDGSEYRLTSSQPNEVVFGIITKDAQGLPDIPFFSKITFCAVKKHLEMMNIQVSVAAIPKEH